MTSPHQYMFAWASLIHSSSYILLGLDRAMRDEFGLSIVEQDLLSQLSLRGEKLRFVDLSERINLSKAGITKMMDRLEKGGLVKRQPSAQDRRAINAILTKKGEELVGKTRTLHRGWVKSHFADFLTEGEIRQLTGILQKILEGNGRWEIHERQLTKSPLKPPRR